MTRRRKIFAGIAILVAVAVVWIWDANRVTPITAKRVDLGNGVTMDFVWIPPGEFMMGSPTDEANRDDNETQHRVKISEGFWMGKYEVTQKQYMAVMGTNPSKAIVGSHYPVDYVSWNNAVAFFARVKERTGLEMRLPTEAEWEYACRARTTTAYNTGDTEADLGRAGCFHSNSDRGSKFLMRDRRRKEPKRVGKFVPNAWGLYDMHGNMREWCSDWYGQYPTGMVADPKGPETGWYRVLRGGSLNCCAQNCRSALRIVGDPTDRGDVNGFRCVLAR